MTMTNAFSGLSGLAGNKQVMIERREKLLGPAYKLFYQTPVHIVRGECVWLYDDSGAAYLDVYNNVASVGHCHPRIVQAMAAQAATLNTHTRYLHDGILEYAEHLLSKFPAPLSQVMFTCSGSEANDLAYRIAKGHTGGDGMIVTSLAYHGGTDVIAGMSPSLGEGVAVGRNVRLVPPPDSYRHDGDVGAIFANHVRAAAEDLRRAGVQPAALIVDTIFSSDGVFSDPAGFLQQAAAVIREFGGVFIADEVQPGFGRTGDHWWGFQRHGLVPDMVTLGKGMGAGYPLAGVVARPDLLKAFNGSRYFNTTGGTPVACVVGKTVLDIIEQEALMESAASVGAYLRQSINDMRKTHIAIGDVRGDGLFIGVEIVSDQATRAPSGTIASAIVNGLRQKHVLISSAGPHANILKIRPPLPFNKQHADHFLQRFDDVISACGQSG